MSTTAKTEKPEISNKYTQRQWDRVVGIGKVPPEYKLEEYNVKENDNN